MVEPSVNTGASLGDILSESAAAGDGELVRQLQTMLQSEKIPDWCPRSPQVLLTLAKLNEEKSNVEVCTHLASLLNTALQTISIPSQHEEQLLQVYLTLQVLADKLQHLPTHSEQLPEKIMAAVTYWETLHQLHMDLVVCWPHMVRPLLQQVGGPLLSSVLAPSLLHLFRQTRCKELNALLERSSGSERAVFRAANCHLFGLLPESLMSAGDYDFQSCLVEMLFRLSNSTERSTRVTEWFPRLHCTHHALLTRIKDFDPDCRVFLNALNSHLGSSRRVYTMAASSATIGCLPVLKPRLASYKQLWVDLNLGSGAVSVLCDKADPHLPSQDRQWETLTMYHDEVLRATVRHTLHGDILELTLDRPVLEYFASPPQHLEQGEQQPAALCDPAPVFRAVFEPSAPHLEAVARRLYGPKLQVESQLPLCARGGAAGGGGGGAAAAAAAAAGRESSSTQRRRAAAKGASVDARLKASPRRGYRDARSSRHTLDTPLTGKSESSRRLDTPPHGTPHSGCSGSSPPRGSQGAGVLLVTPGRSSPECGAEPEPPAAAVETDQGSTAPDCSGPSCESRAVSSTLLPQPTGTSHGPPQPTGQDEPALSADDGGYEDAILSFILSSCPPASESHEGAMVGSSQTTVAASEAVLPGTLSVSAPHDNTPSHGRQHSDDGARDGTTGNFARQQSVSVGAQQPLAGPRDGHPNEGTSGTAGAECTTPQQRRQPAVADVELKTDDPSVQATTVSPALTPLTSSGQRPRVITSAGSSQSVMFRGMWQHSSDHLPPDPVNRKQNLSATKQGRNKQARHHASQIEAPTRDIRRSDLYVASSETIHGNDFASVEPPCWSASRGDRDTESTKEVSTDEGARSVTRAPSIDRSSAPPASSADHACAAPLTPSEAAPLPAASSPAHVMTPAEVAPQLTASPVLPNSVSQVTRVEASSSSDEQSMVPSSLTELALHAPPRPSRGRLSLGRSGLVSEDLDSDAISAASMLILHNTASKVMSPLAAHHSRVLTEIDKETDRDAVYLVDVHHSVPASQSSDALDGVTHPVQSASDATPKKCLETRPNNGTLLPQEEVLISILEKAIKAGEPTRNSTSFFMETEETVQNSMINPLDHVDQSSPNKSSSSPVVLSQPEVTQCEGGSAPDDMASSACNGDLQAPEPFSMSESSPELAGMKRRLDCVDPSSESVCKSRYRRRAEKSPLVEKSWGSKSKKARYSNRGACLRTPSACKDETRTSATKSPLHIVTKVSNVQRVQVEEGAPGEGEPLEVPAGDRPNESSLLRENGGADETRDDPEDFDELPDLQGGLTQPVEDTHAESGRLNDDNYHELVNLEEEAAPEEVADGAAAYVSVASLAHEIVSVPESQDNLSLASKQLPVLDCHSLISSNIEASADVGAATDFSQLTEAFSFAGATCNSSCERLCESLETRDQQARSTSCSEMPVDLDNIELVPVPTAKIFITAAATAAAAVATATDNASITLVNALVADRNENYLQQTAVISPDQHVASPCVALSREKISQAQNSMIANVSTAQFNGEITDADIFTENIEGGIFAYPSFIGNQADLNVQHGAGSKTLQSSELVTYTPKDFADLETGIIRILGSDGESKMKDMQVRKYVLGFSDYMDIFDMNLSCADEVGAQERDAAASRMGSCLAETPSTSSDGVTGGGVAVRSRPTLRTPLKVSSTIQRNSMAPPVIDLSASNSSGGRKKTRRAIKKKELPPHYHRSERQLNQQVTPCKPVIKTDFKNIGLKKKLFDTSHVLLEASPPPKSCDQNNDETAESNFTMSDMVPLEYSDQQRRQAREVERSNVVAIELSPHQPSTARQRRSGRSRKVNNQNMDKKLAASKEMPAKYDGEQRKERNINRNAIRSGHEGKSQRYLKSGAIEAKRKKFYSSKQTETRAMKRNFNRPVKNHGLFSASDDTSSDWSDKGRQKRCVYSDLSSSDSGHSWLDGGKTKKDMSLNIRKYGGGKSYLKSYLQTSMRSTKPTLQKSELCKVDRVSPISESSFNDELHLKKKRTRRTAHSVFSMDESASDYESCLFQSLKVNAAETASSDRVLSNKKPVNFFSSSSESGSDHDEKNTKVESNRKSVSWAELEARQRPCVEILRDCSRSSVDRSMALLYADPLDMDLSPDLRNGKSDKLARKRKNADDAQTSKKIKQAFANGKVVESELEISLVVSEIEEEKTDDRRKKMNKQEASTQDLTKMLGRLLANPGSRNFEADKVNFFETSTVDTSGALGTRDVPPPPNNTPVLATHHLTASSPKQQGSWLNEAAELSRIGSSSRSGGSPGASVGPLQSTFIEEPNTRRLLLVADAQGSTSMEVRSPHNNALIEPAAPKVTPCKPAVSPDTGARDLRSEDASGLEHVTLYDDIPERAWSSENSNDDHLKEAKKIKLKVFRSNDSKEGNVAVASFDEIANYSEAPNSATWESNVDEEPAATANVPGGAAGGAMEGEPKKNCCDCPAAGAAAGDDAAGAGAVEPSISTTETHWSLECAQPLRSLRQPPLPQPDSTLLNTNQGNVTPERLTGRVLFSPLSGIPPLQQQQVAGYATGHPSAAGAAVDHLLDELLRAPLPPHQTVATTPAGGAGLAGPLYHSQSGADATTSSSGEQDMVTIPRGRLQKMHELLIGLREGFKSSSMKVDVVLNVVNATLQSQL